MKSNFNQNLVVGQIGEEAVRKHLGSIYEVRDYTNYEVNKGYQQKGFDFEFFDKDSNTWERVEVKTNIQPKGFTFLELYKPDQTLGWFFTSKADWIYCYSLHTRDIFKYGINSMRTYVDMGLKNLTLSLKEVRNKAKGIWVNVHSTPGIEKVT